MESFHLADLHSSVKLYSTDCVSQCLLFPLSQGALLQDIEVKFCYAPFFFNMDMLYDARRDMFFAVLFSRSCLQDGN